ncbi:MAG: OmpL47-type beta-barrel domain-containing protein [Spirochaetota bacterium]
MYKKLAISLFCLCIALSTVSVVAQDEGEDSTAEEEEVVIDDATLEEVTTESPTADVGLDQPADRDVTEEEDLIEPEEPEPIETEPTDTIDQTQTTQPEDANGEMPYTTTTQQAQSGRTYYDGVNTYANSRVQFRLRASDNSAVERVVYSIDNEEEQTYTSPFTIEQEGRHSITYYGVDQIGNTENQKMFNVIIDNTAPAITVTTDSPIRQINGRYYIARNARISIDAQDQMSGVRSVMYTVNGTDYRNYTTSFSVNAVDDINFQVKAEDNVGNISENYRIMLPDAGDNQSMQQNRSLTFYVDNEAPTVNIAADREFIQRNGRAVAGNDYRYSITAQDDDSGVDKILYRTDGQGSFRTYEQPFMLRTNGDHFIEAKAVDAVGNVSDVKVLSVYVDVIPPNSDITTITEEGESQPQQ